MKRIKLADRKLPDYTKGEEVMNMVREIKTAFDMDYSKNHNVTKSYTKLTEMLESMGFRYGTYIWDPRFKGLDDYIWEYCFQKERPL